MALKYVSNLKSFFSQKEFVSESILFRMHCQLTAALLIGCSLIMTASEFYGESITCVTDLPPKAIANYCWINSTYTIQDFMYRKVEKSVAQPGVLSPEGKLEAKWTFHNYYQWVVFFLCFQAALFYFPKLVWNTVKGRLMRSIANILNNTLYKDEDVGDTEKVVNYIISHRKMNYGYVVKYWACEAFCFVNLVLQMYFVDKFFSNQFLTYGTEVMNYSNMNQTERADPMFYLLPRTTQCIFRKYGPSGNIELHDAFCFLPLEDLNKMIFILQWFWFIILAFLFGVLLIYRALLFCVPSLRLRVMLQHTPVPREELEVFSQKTNIGYWWILYVLYENIHPLIYMDIVAKLAKEIETNASNSNFPSSAPAMFPSSSF